MVSLYVQEMHCLRLCTLPLQVESCLIMPSLRPRLLKQAKTLRISLWALSVIWIVHTKWSEERVYVYVPYPSFMSVFHVSLSERCFVHMRGAYVLYLIILIVAVIALTPTHLEVRSYVLRGFTVKTKETLSVAFAYNDYMSVELLPITYPHDVSGPDSMPSPSSSSIANNRAVFASATTAAAAGSSLYVKAPVYQPVLRIRISYPSPDALLRSPADSVDFSATWDHRRSSAQPPTVITVLLPDRTLSPASPLNPVSLLSRLQKLKEAALVQAEAEVADDLSARDEWRRVRKPVSDSLSALPVAPSFHPPSLGSEGKAAILRL